MTNRLFAFRAYAAIWKSDLKYALNGSCGGEGRPWYSNGFHRYPYII
jgi:hypothetical protein